MRWMLCVIALTPCFAWAETVSFEEFTNIPANSAEQLFFANTSSVPSGSQDYDGITWDMNAVVFGNQYATSGSPPNFGTVFGTGTYALTNGNNATDLVIQTNMVLTSSWWGRNEYDGFSGGATNITIVATAASGTLSVNFDLPSPGSDPSIPPPNGTETASPLEQIDTGAFASLTGITQYDIIVNKNVENNLTEDVNWVADNFTFVQASTVPEPSSLSLLTLGLIAVTGTWVFRWQTLQETTSA